MIDPAYVQMMSNYNKWFNDRLYACCESLPEEELRKDRGAYFKSIFLTLSHLVDADESFLTAFSGNAPHPEPNRALVSFAQLRQIRIGLDDRVDAWATTVTSDWLAEPVTFASRIDSAPRTVERAAFVVHMFNHQTHHRGQVTTLLSQLGLDVGVTDLHGSF
jgi:uncharacterized damage-inducible protein DinB